MKRFPVDVSYLAPRDPSIVSRYGRPMPRKQNLTFGEDISEEESIGNVKVFLRVKPQNAVEVGPEVPSFKILGADSLITTSWIRGKQFVQQFRFTSVLPERASQQLVFDSVARRPLQALLASQRSGLLFTYGTTNAGKTHTMFGNDIDPGLIPLSLSAIFSSLDGSLLPGPQLKPSDAGVAELDKDSQVREMALRSKLLEWNPKLGEDTYSMSMMSGSHRSADCAALPVMALHANLLPGQRANVWVSCVEIYQEQAFDLLASNQTSALPLRGDHVRGLTIVCVESASDAQRLLLLARHKLRSAETGLNLRSSRSHCVFAVHIALSTPSRPHSQMQFDFVDLAGSERASKTHNQGLRLLESSKINQSLSVLGRCLKAMRSNQKGGTEVVPFRDSLLTRLLKTPLLSLGGENVSLLVCASAETKTFAETCKALQFASIARRVQLRLPPRPSQAAPSRFSMLAVARPSCAGWLAPPIPAPRGQGDGCPGCRRAEQNTVARLAENETRLRRELVEKFSVMLNDKDERHRLDIINQESRLMELVKHREDQMLATMAAQEQQQVKPSRSGKRMRKDSSDTSDSEDDGELDQAAADEIKQLRDEVSAAAKAVAEAEFRAANAELRLREMSASQQDTDSGLAETSARLEVIELNALLEEARIDHLRDRSEVEQLREALHLAQEDAALKEMERDDALASADELRACLDARSTTRANSLEAAHQDLLEKIATLKSSELRLEAELSASEALKTQLQERILAYDASEDDLVTKMAALETRETKASSHLIALEAELSQLREIMSQRDAELVTLRQRVVSEDNKETNLELEVKRLLQQLRTVTEEHDATCAALRTTKATLARAQGKLDSLGAENEGLLQSIDRQQREGDERMTRSAAQFTQLEELLRREREALSLAKRDSAAATAQLYRLTPARHPRSLSTSNVDEAKENSAVGANLAPPERPLTRSSRRIKSTIVPATAPSGNSKKASRKLFVQPEAFSSPEPSPEVQPRTRSRRK